VYSVRHLTRDLRRSLERGFSGIWVEGEISNFKRHSSGHCYFTLKDDEAQLRAVMFRSQARFVRLNPQDGMLVRVLGDISVYEQRGDLQVMVKSMQLAGEGALLRAFETLKRRLAAEGLFDAAHKKPLPAYPRRIGVVTSDSGAALHDILTIIRRRYPCVTVMLMPVQVQGMGAGEEIARAVTAFNFRADRPDVLIVGRGGGSMEDLWAFNEEVVARAIYASEIPVISAVGHETDFSIADFVADVRAATPSMAAELAVPDRQELAAAIRQRAHSIQNCLTRTVDRYRRHIEYLTSSHHFLRPRDLLRHHAQNVDELIDRLGRCARQSIAHKRRHVESLLDRLVLLRPDLPLERGFVLVERDGSLVRHAADVKPGDGLALRFHDGRRQVRAVDGKP